MERGGCYSTALLRRSVARLSRTPVNYAAKRVSQSASFDAVTFAFICFCLVYTVIAPRVAAFCTCCPIESIITPSKNTLFRTHFWRCPGSNRGLEHFSKRKFTTITTYLQQNLLCVWLYYQFLTALPNKGA